MKILTLIDGSGGSHKAAHQVMEIGKKKKIEVTFLGVLDRHTAKMIAFNVYSKNGICDSVTQHEEQIWREMRKTMLDELHHLVTLFTKEKIPCSMKIIEGEVQEVIIQETGTEAYDLVVMGAFGKKGRSHLGSLTEKISGEISQPVMVVR